ncbi:MAG: dephospho-CoA kinase [Syntrophales bacterium]
MLNVGLTGGIASGKSTVASMLQEKGAYLIDFDEIAHYVEEPGRPAWKAIVENFGSNILDEDGAINRARLGAIVFQDKEKLAILNHIVHPHVISEWQRRINDLERTKPDGICLSDIPLLIEGKFQRLFEVVVLVYISSDEQIERMMNRNGCSREDALLRLASQMPIDEKIPYADIIINNQGSVERTREIVNQVWEELLKRRIPT